MVDGFYCVGCHRGDPRAWRYGRCAECVDAHRNRVALDHALAEILAKVRRAP